MNIFSYISLTAFLICFFLGNFIYHKNSKSQLNIMIAVLCILVGFLAFAEYQYRQTLDFETAYLWLRISGLWPLVPSVLLHISLIFTGRTNILKNKLTYVIIYVPAIIISILAVDTNLLLQGIVKEYWGWTYIFPVNSLLFDIMSLWTLLCGFLAGSICFLYYLKTNSNKRRQSKYILLGLYFPLLISMVSDLILPTMSIRVPETSLLMSTVGVSFISYGIWKYRFPALTAAVAADEIVSTMSNFLIMLDHQKTIVTVNDATSNLLGYEKAEIIGRDVEMIFADQTVQDGVNLFKTGTDSISNIETYFKSKNGDIIPALLSKSLIKDDDGNILGIICIGSNIIQIKDAENEIKASLIEKELLLRELHHRVKNNLQIILSLINLQSVGIKDQEDLEIFRESQSRVKSMALIHEKLYQSSDFARVDFESYIRSLISYLFGYYSIRGIENEISVEDNIVLNMDTAVPCGLIINELVTNSIKHAFKGIKSGKVSVKFHSQDGCYTLIVSDNGTGLPKDFDVRNPEKLGLKLVNSLTDQLDGRLEVHSNGGTTFKIRFHEIIYKDRVLNSNMD